MTEPTTPSTTEESGEPIPFTKGGGIITEESTTPPPADTTTPTTGVIIIPPLGLDKVAKLTGGLAAWWGKHGSAAREAVVDLIAVIAEVLKPTPPPSPPTPPSQPTPPATPTP